MTEPVPDLSGLTPERKRELLTKLLMAKAADAASAHPLSYGQRALWFVHQLDPDSAAYTIAYAARIPGELDVEALQRAVQALVDRHPILRTTYAERDGQPVQLVHPRWPLHITRQHIGTNPAEIDEWVERETNRPFDLYTGPVLRVTLLERGAAEADSSVTVDHVLVLAVHHIAVDFWSVDVILDELRELYAAERGGPTPAVPGERYVDYAERQARMLDGPGGEELWRYWSRRLAGELPTLHLPTDRPRPAVQTYNGALYRFGFGPAVTADLKQVARSAGATPFMLMLTAYAALLHRYTGQDDVIIGSPFACRDSAAMTGLVGYIANPLPLRIDVAGDPTLDALLERVKATVLDTIAHQDYPLPLLVERLRPARDASRTPLFQVSFAWDQARKFTGGGAGGALPLETLHIGQGGAPFDITLQVGEHDGELQAGFQYNTDLFDAATIERMAEHLITLVGDIAARPGTAVSRLALLTDTERELIEQWNQTRVDYPDAPSCLHEMVSATARRMPDAVAVTFHPDPEDGGAGAGSEVRELTYAELDRRANRLAHRLQRMGLGASAAAGASHPVVPVLLERSEDLVIGLLGALKAGAAFLPLDPAQPPHRLEAILADLPDAPVCVTRTEHLAAVPAEFTGARLCLDRPVAAGQEPPETAPPSGVGGGNLAYLIYTSGSTGTPKGALNTHAGIRNRLLWMQDAYPITEADRVLHKTPINFDPFIWEIFWPLIVGARVVIAKPEGHKDTGYLTRTIIEQDVTTMHFVPSMLRRFLAAPDVSDCAGLRQVFCSGEALTADVRDRFHAALPAELYNLYGPTEAAIDVTHFHCRRGDSSPIIPIGRPIANIAVHVLDPHRQPVPIGVPGELCISGVGVARGYLNRPEATAAAFVDDPFADRSSYTALMYRTGDRVRYLPGGDIEYLGRMDDQVKINGFRIEPGEIEAALSAHPQIGECAVVSRPGPGEDPQLVAHLVVAGGAAPTTAELRRFLLDRLPAAMIPAVFRVAEALPLTASGKVDRRALAGDDAAEIAAAREYVAPRNRTEQVLADIWSAVLELDRVGVTDDFFGLGGASTQALEVAVRAAAAGLELRPESMFVHGTIADLAAEYGPLPEDAATREQAAPPVSMSPAATEAAVRPEPQPVTAAPMPATPVPARPQDTRNTVIESLGVYLPQRSVSTDQVLADCVNEVAIPLERVTGIKNRRMAGDGEYSIDLARNAATDCLSRSGYPAEEIEVVIACNISRADGPEMFTFEPSTAAQLRDQLGLGGAICFDINNACGGMFTGITVADAFLKTGLVRNALVVSGEYITHLTDTAQREIAGPIDPRLACLTLGDAGAAVVLERGPDDRIGFHDIDLATVSRYAKLCIAKVSDGPHGGAIMTTDSVTQTAVAVKHAVPYVTSVLQRHGWRPDTADHLIMHQTSEASINDAILAINRVFGKGAATRENTICNLAERGNTATTTHFVALYDYIKAGRINSGDNIVFSVTGSGQTVGTALYTFDDLPDRMRHAIAGGDGLKARSRPAQPRRELPRIPRVRIDSVAVADVEAPGAPSSIRLATDAARACLQDSTVDPRTVGLLVHSGVYRDDYLSEPAVAALVACDLGLNDSTESADEPKTFTFDVLNGAVGFLNACQVAATMMAAGTTRSALVSASEIENNAADSGHPRNGLTETGSAILITSGDGETGFGRFVFAHHPEYRGALSTHTEQTDGRTWLRIDRDPDLDSIYLNCIPGAVKELLAQEGLQPGDIAAVFGPHLPASAVDDLAARIDIPRSRFVELDVETDPFTSSLPYNFQYAQQHNKVRPGDIALIIAAGSGVEVGCTTYRF